LINVPLLESRIYGTEREIQQVINDKRGDDRSAPAHGSRCVTGMHGLFPDVAGGARFRLFTASRMDDQMCSRTITSSTIRVLHNSAGMLRRRRPYALSFSGPSKNCKFPIRWPATNPN